jgi:hypothetical protein
MRQRYGLRRRAASMSVCAGLIALGVALPMGIANAGAPPPRHQIHLFKLCPPTQANPKFHVINETNSPDPTDKQWAPQTITFWITRGAKPNAPKLFTGTLAPGQDMYVTLWGQPWPGPFFAQFDSLYRGVRKLRTDRQFCNCESASDSSSTSTTPTSSPSDSSSTSTTPTSSPSDSSSTSTTIDHYTTSTEIGTATSVVAGNSSTTVAVSGATVTTGGSSTTKPAASNGSTGSGPLPFTGGYVGAIAVLGAVLLAAGLAMRRRIHHV